LPLDSVILSLFLGIFSLLFGLLGVFFLLVGYCFLLFFFRFIFLFLSLPKVTWRLIITICELWEMYHTGQ
jgi:hypothetical protein